MWHDKLRRGSGVVDERIGGGEEGGSEEAAAWLGGLCGGGI